VQRTLSRRDILKIVDIRLREVQQRLADRKMTLDIDDDGKQYLVSGYSTTYGARPLNRTIQSELLNPLSVMLLADRIRDGETIRVRFDGPRNRLRVLPNHEGKDDVNDMDVDDDIEIEEMD
jgi:ATP-dependent Clp protease ATP-binding subunit ClpB